MSRTNTGSTANYLAVVPGAGYLSMPFSLACWARTTDLTVNQFAMSSVVTSSDIKYFGIGFAGGKVRLHTRDSGTFETKDGTTSISSNVWQHIAGVWTSATSRRVYLNGVEENSGTVSIDQVSEHNAISALVLLRSSKAGPFNGGVAWLGQWNIALGADAILAMAHRAHPLRYNPVRFWPCTGESSGNEISLTGLNPLIKTGTVGVAESPAISVGWPMLVTRAEAAAPATPHVAPFIARRRAFTPLLVR